VTTRSLARSGGLELARPDHDLLLARAARAVRRARRTGEALVGLTIPLRGDHDPSAVVLSSRREDEPWFSLEQPEREGAVLAALGCVRAIDARGPRRFAATAAQWRDLVRDAEADPPDGPPGAGLVAVGGFAFAEHGGAAPHWAGYPPASLHVPEVAIARRGDDTRLTVAALATADDTPDDVVARIHARLATLAQRPLPMLDPEPSARARIASVAPPEHYEAAVARAVEQIRAGAFEKIVLAREVAVHAPRAHDAAAVFDVLRQAFRSCYVFCAGRGDAAFVAASPELLVRRDGLRAQTVALAGSSGPCGRGRCGWPPRRSRRSSASRTSSTWRRRSAPSCASRSRP
jgi:isochorismate synthase EntC